MKLMRFYKKFADGEQNMFLRNGKVIYEQKVFYWKSNDIYNKIKPAIELLKAKYKDKLTDKMLYGKGGFVESMLPVQRAYNELMNKQKEIINRLAEEPVVVEDGSVDVDALEEEGLSAGKILVYRQGSNVPQQPFKIGQEYVNILEYQRKCLLEEFSVIMDCFEQYLQSLKVEE